MLDLTNWHEYLKTLMAAGFRRSTEISSQNSVLLVYALYLVGRHRYGLSHSQLRTTIARYFFMASLTGRYTGSFETRITQDVQAFTAATTATVTSTSYARRSTQHLPSDFWAITLPRDLATSAARAPGLFAYAAALCLLDARMPPFVQPRAPREARRRQRFVSATSSTRLSSRRRTRSIDITSSRASTWNRSVSPDTDVNQIANLSYVEWPENIAISATPPSEYWPKFEAQFTDPKTCSITRCPRLAAT